MISAIQALALAVAAASPVTESDISAPGPNGPLKGMLTSAGKANAPVVLIIPGSGPTDRNGNSPLGVRAATYRLLGAELAAKGVSTVRVDKRGMFASAGAVPDANAVTIEDYARDTHAWVDAIRQRTGAKCVWLLGHSEGGLVALAAARHDADVCGLVLLPDVNHVLKRVTSDASGANVATYADPNLPLAPGVAGTVAEFVKEDRRPRSGAKGR